MQFVATWQDNVTAGVRASLAALQSLRGAADEADEALRRVAAPRKVKIPAVGGGGSESGVKAPRAVKPPVAGDTPAKTKEKVHFTAAGFQASFLKKREEAQQRDNALAGLGLGVSRQEKDKARVEKAEKARRDREDKARKSNSISGGFTSVFTSRFAGKALGVGAAVALVGLIYKAVAGARALAGSFAMLTMGPLGLARANALIAQAGLRFRMMFLGINTRPATDALAKFLSFTNKQTTAGKVIQATVQRWGSALMKVFAGAEPVASQFVDGLLLGVIKLETSFWRLVKANAPIVVGLEDWHAAMLKSGGYAKAVETTFGAIAKAVMATVEAMLKLHGAYMKVSGALADERPWNPVSGTSEKPAERGWFAKTFAPTQSEVKAKMAAAGVGSGAAFDAGVVTGVEGGLPAVEAAGRAVAGAADKGTRDKGEIHSPSRLFARHGRYMAAGLAAGIMAGAPEVNLAARDALVPDMGPLTSRSAMSTGALGRGGAASQRPISIVIQGDVYGVADLEARVERAARRAAREEIAADNLDAAKELGIS